MADGLANDNSSLHDTKRTAFSSPCVPYGAVVLFFRHKIISFFWLEDFFIQFPDTLKKIFQVAPSLETIDPNFL